jgi:hypothetical protein
MIIFALRNGYELYQRLGCLRATQGGTHLKGTVKRKQPSRDEKRYVSRYDLGWNTTWATTSSIFLRNDEHNIRVGSTGLWGQISPVDNIHSFC